MTPDDLKEFYTSKIKEIRRGYEETIQKLQDRLKIQHISIQHEDEYTVS